MSRARLELADIFRQYGASYWQAHRLSVEQRRAFRAIELCRSAALGGHVDQCDSCGHLRVSYNSCRNRHCPKCQALVKAEWLEARQAELLGVEYYHVVFTIPDCLAAIGLQNKRVFYNILFRAASQTLLRIAADPKHLGAEVGFLAVLHTWGQNLLHHPHLHCVVPGGGLSADGQRWVACRKGFFLPVRVLSRLFRRLFLEQLSQAFDDGRLEFYGSIEGLASSEAFSRLLARACQTEWVVYAKRPFAGPAQVLDYLGQYTHRVAISNSRLLKLEAGRVTFSWRDYSAGNAVKVMELEASEFIRRFLLHILPQRFQRIRYYGLFGNRHRKAKLALCRSSLGQGDSVESEPQQSRDWKKRYQLLTGVDIDICPVCQKGRMQMVESIEPLQSWRQSVRPGIDSS